MKKTKKIVSVLVTVFLIISIIVSIGSVVMGIHFARQISGDEIAVFDYLNFFCTAIFSFIALGFSVFELYKSRVQEKENEQRDSEVYTVKRRLKDLMNEKKAEVESLNQIRATDEIIDFPTYSDLPLSRICNIYESFHMNSVGAAIVAIQVYTKSARSALSAVLEKCEYLPVSVVNLAVSMSRDLGELETETIGFFHISGINFWLSMEKRSLDDNSPEGIAARDKLYEDGCEMCIIFEKLYTKMSANLQMFEVLFNAIKTMK